MSILPCSNMICPLFLIMGNACVNKKLEAEGAVEKVTGHVQEKVGQIKKVLGR